MYNMLSSFKHGRKMPVDIKAKFRLSSEVLLKLAKLIQNTEITKEESYGIIQRLLGKVRSSH